MRTALAVAIAAASLFAVAALASAEGTLTLSASASKVTYPHSVKLTVSFPTTEPVVAQILARPAGASEWTTVTVFATETTPSVWVKPKVTTTYKAWVSDESSSAPVTVEVAAHLFKPQINGHVHKGHSYTVKGQMQPAEAGTVTVSYWRMETTHKYYTKHGVGHVRHVDAWVLHSSVDVALTTKAGSQTSKWAAKWKPLEKGWWKVVVTHEDVSHVKSSATTYKWVRL
jgi:hypothetical protein